jgi:FlaA1/EpsC-like NDP-sugar epimerase
MLLGDTVLVALAYYLAHYIRFDGTIPYSNKILFTHSIGWIIPVKLICFIVCKLYRGMWRYTSIYDMLNILKTSILSSAIVVLVAVVTVRLAGFSRGELIIAAPSATAMQMRRMVNFCKGTDLAYKTRDIITLSGV